MSTSLPSVRKAKYNALKAKGLCVKCGLSKTEGKTCCIKCQNQYRTQHQLNSIPRRCRQYKISVTDYNTLLSDQEGKCAICHIFMWSPCIDHDHVTGKVRQLLCKRCNACLGLLDENEVWLENMIAYLHKFRASGSNPPYHELTSSEARENLKEGK